MKEPFVIGGVWAVLTRAPDGDDALAMAIHSRTGQMVPLIAADEERLADMKDIARDLARQHHQPFRLVRFAERTDLEIFHPDGRRERPT